MTKINWATKCPQCGKGSWSEREMLDKSCRICGFYSDECAAAFILSQGYIRPTKLPIGWCAIQEMVMGEYDVLVNISHDFIDHRICFIDSYDAHCFLSSWDGIEMPVPDRFNNITKIK